MAYEIYQGDCLEVLKQYPDSYFDSVVTDPPYELGFMGKKWDSTGIAYNIELWQEVLRVLKPGGHLLAFGGTRTYHRMTCAIEDAGFEIRDQMQWIYGCLSEDTEILTINGWEHYHKAIELHPVLCYNMDKDTFEFCKPERSFIYENKHTAYRIQSDYTDQIVSRNHRCIVERGGRKVFAYAETLEQQESVPILESLHDLPESIPNIYEGTSIKKQDLLERVRQQECKHSEYWQSPAGAVRRQNACNVCSVWETGMETQSMVKKGGNAYLQSSMQRSIKGAGMEAACAQRQTKLDGRIREVSQRKNDRAEQSCMEGRRNLLQNTWELCWSKICSLPGRIYGNVKKRRLCNGTPFNSCANTRKMLKEDGSRSSHRPQSSQQRPEQFNVICEQPTAQEIRSDGATRTTLATITPIEYHGNVWCVQVPTGAFVARRNGHIFITGNSGFPKSMDISKAIDKQAGAEREVIGRNQYVKKRPQKEYNHEQKWGKTLGGSESTLLTAPATPEAQEWEGWGTALKPANEPIVLARKPLSEKTIADNVLKWGTGGINIDDCRVEYQSEEDLKQQLNNFKGHGKQNHSAKSTFTSIKNHDSNKVNTQGRFPANVILDEEAGKLLDEQSGIRPAGNGNAETGVATNGQGVPPLRRGKLIPRNDTGGASRFFKNCSYDKEEISWLRSQRYAQFVKENLLTMCAIIEITVPESAMQSLNVLKEILVNYAESQLKTIDMDTVLKNVVILQSQEDSQLNNMIIRFMKEMLNVLKKKDESSIKQMMNIGKKLEQELKHTTMEKLKCNHVRYVEIQLLISIMTITQNLLNTDGYAESVTSIYMLSNTEVGEKDYQLASRFKYCAKASKKERGDSKHPTVKPLSLMRYLCRLITPPEGIVLDPFAGSGTTLEAAILEGFNVVGIEKEHDYIPDIRRRIERAQLNTQAPDMGLFLFSEEAKL